MRKLIVFLIIILICTIYIVNDKEFNSYISNYLNYIYEDENIIDTPSINEYKTAATSNFVELTTNFIPSDKQELINVYYTVLNFGWKEFTFKCNKKYISCINDLQSISKNNELLSDINNRVHPYNSFSNISTSYIDENKITITVTPLYNENEIAFIEKESNEIIKNYIKKSMTEKQKIKILHDYIINKTKYDSNNDGISPKKANGIFIDGLATCSGYTDLMAIFLHKLNIPNIKISSDTHIWNLVNIGNSWYHLDLTWDDPITSNGKNLLYNTYFLVSSDKLTELDKKEKQNHQYDNSVYPEA